MFDERTLFDFCLYRIKCRIILFLTLYESRSKSRWTKIMSISKNCSQNRRFVFWNRQKWNLFRSIFILMKTLMKKHNWLLIVYILSYWTLINSIRIMRMILSWWWMITKFELKSWVVSSTFDARNLNLRALQMSVVVWCVISFADEHDRFDFEDSLWIHQILVVISQQSSNSCRVLKS
jgi:hypothetical protein